MAYDSTISSSASGSLSGRTPGEVLRHLERLLEREDQRLDTRRGELADVRSAIQELSLGATKSSLLPVTDLEVVPAENAVDVIGELVASMGDGVLRTVTRTVEYGPGREDERVHDLRGRLADGLVMRTVYPLSALDTSVGRRWVSSWSEAGEQQRFVPDPPSEFLIAGATAVFACADWNVPESDYVVIREPMLVAAFTALHDTSYATGTELALEGGYGYREARLVDLMALGLKDEAIARMLGTSLRTVRRRISALMDEHGVQTRFQLGAALLARGRLEAGPLPLSPIRSAVADQRRR